MTHYIFSSVKSKNLRAERACYYKKIGVALDGMWSAFVDMGTHWAIANTQDNQHQDIGYCVVNDDNKVLQFMSTHPAHSAPAFAQMIGELKITGAYVASCETAYLAQCRDHQSAVKTNGIMYQEGESLPVPPLPKGIKFRLVTNAELDIAVGFGGAALGCDLHWLRGYYQDRINACELYGYWQDGGLIAAGECRPSTLPYACADVGMVVAKGQRGRGLGTDILCRLRAECGRQGLDAICSTEHENIAAQTAIIKAGFIPTHKILDITF